MASNPIDNFLAGLTPETRPVAERVIEAVLRHRFEPTASKFVRRIAFESVDEVDDALIRDLLDLAVDTLSAFRFRAMRRGLAGPARRRS